MVIRHLTYCDKNMTRAALLCKDSALKHGCDSSEIYNYHCLDEAFREKNKDTLAQERGAGYFIWKPQVIFQHMQKCFTGDYVVYTDAGVEFVNSVKYLIEAMDQYCLLFQNHWPHHEWCKGDVLALTGMTSVRQLQASAMIFKVCLDSFQFVKEWLEFCQYPGFIDDSPSRIPNSPSFAEHRWDQAILTAVQIRRGIKPHWWPASYSDGKFEYFRDDHTDTYPIIFNHHRKRNEQF